MLTAPFKVWRSKLVSAIFYTYIRVLCWLHLETKITTQKPTLCAEVSCRDTIRQARVTRNPSAGVRALANVDLKKSETGAHGVFQKYGQSLPVKISRTDLPSKKAFPYVRLSDWLRYTIEYDNLQFLVGVSDVKEMRKLLSCFWERWRHCHPNHVAFTKSNADLSITIPMLMHGDEGRGYKKNKSWSSLVMVR